MSLTYKFLNTESRIAILQGRPKKNDRIIAKLQRELRNIKQKLAKTGPETVKASFYIKTVSAILLIEDRRFESYSASLWQIA